jgi:hypothetical protein
MLHGSSLPASFFDPEDGGGVNIGFISATFSHLLQAGLLLGLFLDFKDGGDMFLRKVVTFNGLHGGISQRIEVFITTAVRTINRTNFIEVI